MTNIKLRILQGVWDAVLGDLSKSQIVNCSCGDPEGGGELISLRCGVRVIRQVMLMVACVMIFVFL